MLRISTLNMRHSTRFAIAVHTLALLAYKGGARLTSHTVAESVNTHPVIIRRVLLALRKANLVETRKGAGCGSRLSRRPEEIDLAQVYRAVGGAGLSRPVKQPNPSCPVGQAIGAALERLFGSADEAMQRELSRTTLADVLATVKAHDPKMQLQAA